MSRHHGDGFFEHYGIYLISMGAIKETCPFCFLPSDSMLSFASKSPSSHTVAQALFPGCKLLATRGRFFPSPNLFCNPLILKPMDRIDFGFASVLHGKCR